MTGKQRMVGWIHQILCITSFVCAGFMFIFHMTSYLSLLVLGFVCLGGWLLNRAGHQQSSAALLVASLIVALEYNLYQGYGIHDVAIIAWPAIIFFAGLLFGSRVIPYFTVLIMLLAFATAEIPNAMNFRGDVDTGDLIVVLMLLTAFTFISTLFLRDREHLMEGLHRSDERFQAIYNAINDAIFIHDVQTGAIVDVNQKMLEMYGYTREEVLSLNMAELCSGQSPYTPEDGLAWIQKAASQGEQHFEWQAKDKNGRLFWVDVNMKLASIDNLPRILVSVRDVSEHKRAEELLRYQSSHDSLTGIYNRSFFEEELARLDRGREFPISIIVADVDGLKLVNDTLGHAAGDELLRKAAQVLSTVFRAEDVLARIGGDEFAALLPETDAKTAESIVARIREHLARNLSANPDTAVQLSIGVATTVTNNLARTFTTADQRMYADKAARKLSRQNDLAV